MFELFFSKPNQRKNTSLYAEGSFSSASHTLTRTHTRNARTHTHALQRNKSRALFFFFSYEGALIFFPETLMQSWFQSPPEFRRVSPGHLFLCDSEYNKFFTETCENKNKRTLLIKNRTLGENIECSVF